METKYLEQKIMNHIEIRKHLYTYLLVISGGIVSLFFANFTYMKAAFFVAGCCLDIAFINGITKQNDLIEELLLKLKEDA
jgi:hypothetical protein